MLDRTLARSLEEEEADGEEEEEDEEDEEEDKEEPAEREDPLKKDAVGKCSVKCRERRICATWRKRKNR